jgi:hypothetical protein
MAKQLKLGIRKPHRMLGLVHFEWVVSQDVVLRTLTYSIRTGQVFPARYQTRRNGLWSYPYVVSDYLLSEIARMCAERWPQ